MEEKISSAELSNPGGIGVREWLLPVAALKRFEPPTEMLITAPAKEKRDRYGFRISTLGFLIKQGCLSEVLSLPNIWALPGSAPWLLGLVNLRSNLVPVFDLHRIFDLPSRGVSAAQLVLVFDQGEDAVGLLIDDFPRPLSDMIYLPSLPQLPAELQTHVRSGFMEDEMVWLEFDHSSFFDEISRGAKLKTI